jgi:hypothetical protein
MVDLISNIAAGDQGSFRFKWLFLHLLILISCFCTFLILSTSNKNYMLKIGSVYLFPKFQKNPLVCAQLSLGSFLNLLIFILSCSLFHILTVCL